MPNIFDGLVDKSFHMVYVFEKQIQMNIQLETN